MMIITQSILSSLNQHCLKQNRIIIVHAPKHGFDDTCIYFTVHVLFHEMHALEINANKLCQTTKFLEKNTPGSLL